MEISSHPRSTQGTQPGVPSNAPTDDLNGVLPQGGAFRETCESGAIVAGDGVLKVGAFTLSLDAMMRHLDAFAKVTRRIRSVFPDEKSLVEVLPLGTIPIPRASLDFTAAYETFKRAQAYEVQDIDFVRAVRRLEALNQGHAVSAPELETLRGLFMTGAQLATVCTGIDRAMAIVQSHRSFLHKVKDRVVDFAGSVSLYDGRIQTRLREMPFEDLNVRMLRVDADVMAQRIDLRDDGSLAVRRACSAERFAADLLSLGELQRSISLSRGAVQGRLVIRQQDREAHYLSEHRIEDVFSALQLGRSASQLIVSLERDGVNVVRLCRMVDRDTAMGVKACLGLLSPQTHVRLSDVDEWAPRFERDHPQPLSENDRAELGVLLLDAQLCLFVAGHLQNVTQSEETQKFWRKLWGVSMRDRDVKAAQQLVSCPPSPMQCDCDGASEVMSSASMLLGYHYEDRSGAAWRVPENPVVSLAWAMNH